MHTNILDYLECSAEKYPDKMAFSFLNEEITYKELMIRSKKLGGKLAKIISPRAPVAVLMNKSCDAIVSFFGAVYAGGFYSFLDSTQPATRLNSIYNTLQPEAVILNDKSNAKLKELSVSCEIINIDTNSEDNYKDISLDKIRASHIDTDPLYCNFTSGSSGTPKGVLVCHRSVIEFVESFVDIFDISENDVIANQAPLDFDVSVKDIYSGLKTGAEVVLVPKLFFTFLPKLMQLLLDKKVTTLIWAVSALCIISTMKGLEYLFPSNINKVMFSGEVMPINHLMYWRNHYPNANLVNLYGPTEITCNCTYHIIDRDYSSNDILPIGVSFPNERVFLIDENNDLVDIPEKEGEICVSGSAVTLGYYNNRDKTDEVFIQNPLNNSYNEVIYKTGDIARYGIDGLLYFIGRKDFQIKHHGRRIELGEIEAALVSLEGVTRACVLYLSDAKKIISYYIGDAKQKDLIKCLKELLPDYMIPTEFIGISVLPLTNNGKMDRKKLINMWKEKNTKKR